MCYYMLYGVSYGKSSETEDELWLTFQDIAQDFRVPVKRGNIKNFNLFRQFLTSALSDLAEEVVDVVLLVFATIKDSKQMNELCSFIQEVDRLKEGYRVLIHLFPILHITGDSVKKHLKIIKLLGLPTYIFSSKFVDGREANREEIYLLFEYFIKFILSLNGEALKRFLESKGFCAFGCKFLEYPLREITGDLLIRSYAEFRKHQLEEEDGGFDFLLDLDFSGTFELEMPKVNNPFLGKEVEDLLYLADEGFRVDSYLNEIVSQALLDLRKFNLSEFSKNFYENWQKIFNDYLEESSIRKLANYLKGGGSLNSLKKVLIDKRDKLVEEANREVDVCFFELREVYSRFKDKIALSLSAFIDKLDLLKKQKTAKKYIKIFLISFANLFVVFYFLFFKIAHPALLRQILFSGIFASVLSFVLATFYWTHKIRKAREEAQGELNHLINCFEDEIKRAWDAWVSPQKKYIEERFKFRAVDYFKFYLDSLISEIELYENELRENRNIGSFKREKGGTSLIEIEREEFDKVEKEIISQTRIDWYSSIYEDFGSRLDREGIQKRFQRVFSLFQKKLIKIGRENIVFTPAVMGKSLRGKLASLIKGAKRNIPLKLKKDYKPDKYSIILFAPKEFINTLRELNVGEEELLSWRYKEAIAVGMFYQNIKEEAILE